MSKFSLKCLSIDRKKLHFLLFKRVPFEWNNPIGYLITFTFQYIVLGYEYLIIASTLGFLIGIYRFAVSVINEIQHILHAINDEAQTNEYQSRELKNIFSEYIHIHAAIKQLSYIIPFGIFEMQK